MISLGGEGVVDEIDVQPDGKERGSQIEGGQHHAVVIAEGVIRIDGNQEVGRPTSPSIPGTSHGDEKKPFGPLPPGIFLGSRGVPVTEKCPGRDSRDRALTQVPSNPTPAVDVFCAMPWNASMSTTDRKAPHDDPGDQRRRAANGSPAAWPWCSEHHLDVNRTANNATTRDNHRGRDDRDVLLAEFSRTARLCSAYLDPPRTN